MGRLGDVLEAIYEAPRLRGALHARALQVQDAAKMQAVHDWWSRRSFNGSSGRLLVASSGEPGRAEADHELWYRGADRWRADADERVTMFTADGVLTFTPSVGGVRHDAHAWSIPGWDSVLRPRWVLDWFDVEVGEPGEAANRSCWSVSLRARDDGARHSVGMPRWVGTEVTALIDQETGVVLSYVARFEDKVSDSWTTKSFEQVPSVDPAVFAFTPPDGSGFRDASVVAHESMLRRADDLGVDLSDVDVGDHRAVAEAVMRAQHRTFFPSPSVEELARQYVPTGAPPDDAERAEAAIRDAFSRIVTPSEDGTAVPAVEGGGNLGPSLAEAGQRAPGGSDVAPTVTVHLVKFLRSDEAAVWFGLERGGQPLLPNLAGRARRFDDRWLVSRETFAQIVGSVGVRCPPPPP